MVKDDERIIVSVTEGVATMTIHRPAARNALTDVMRVALRDALRDAAAHDDVRVIVVTGGAGAFCAGGDIAVLHDLKVRGDERGMVRLLDDGRAIVEALAHSDKPTIAMVNGVASGAGCLIALACDLRFCSATATFATPFVRLGIGPDWGGSYWLPRLVGMAKALELLYTGASVDAEEALRIGLVNQVWPDDELTERTMELAQSLVNQPAAVLARVKRLIRGTGEQTLEETMAQERTAQLANFHSDACAEGLLAFMEKRPPIFRSSR